MSADLDVIAPQVLDERVITSVLRDDVKAAGGVRRHGAPDVISEREIEGVPACRSQPYQVYRTGVLQQLFDQRHRSEEHTSELQSHSFISYAVFCLKKK